MGHKIKCLLCNTVIEGDKRGHMIYCKCKQCAIDETPYYYRIIGDFGTFEEIKGGNHYGK